MRGQRSEIVQAWAVSALAAAVAGYAACFSLMDTDIWWHLAAGRLMVNEHRLLFADPFAADTLGRPWVNVHWLFQLLVYLLHRLGGIAALVVAKVVLIGLGVALGLRALCARLARPLWLPAAATVVGMLYPARHLMLARPTILTLVAITLVLLIVQRARLDGRLRWALWLIPVQMIWANVQGLYLLGPALLACFVVGDAITAALVAARGESRTEPSGAGSARMQGAAKRRMLDVFKRAVTPQTGQNPPGGRRGDFRHGLLARVWSLQATLPRRFYLGLAALVPLLVLASAATPYGLQGLRLPFVLFGRIDAVAGQVFSREVSENVAPWLLERTSPGLLSAFKWLAALTFLSFLPTLARGLAVHRLCLATLFFGLALMANRNVLLFLWVAGPIVAENLAAMLPAGPGRQLRRLLLVGASIGLSAMILVRAREARGEPPIAELAPFRVPEQAVDHLVSERLPVGPIFCSDRYGGYLTWRLYPDGRPMMDGRLVLRSPERYAEHLALGEHPERFDAYRLLHGIRTVILPTAYPDRFLPLVAWLYRQPAWRLLYTDGTQTLFVHDEDGAWAGRGLDLTAGETVREISRQLETRYGSWPLIHDQARLHLARLLAEVGATGPADALLARLPGITAQALRARVAYQAGDVTRAEQMAKALLASQPNEIESLCLLALLSHERGEEQDALGLVKRALQVDPFHPLARQILGQIQRDLVPAAR